MQASYDSTQYQAFRQKRMAEMQEKTKKGVFGDVREISAEDYKQQVIVIVRIESPDSDSYYCSLNAKIYVMAKRKSVSILVGRKIVMNF